MGSTITVYKLHEGVLSGNSDNKTCIQTVSTIPDGWKGVQEICKSLEYSHCADIHVSQDGRFVYGSNRGHESIVIFAVN